MKVTFTTPVAAMLRQIADHIDHVARIAGRDHVGSDFYGRTDEPNEPRM